jgi:hypothetical protein
MIVLSSAIVFTIGVALYTARYLSFLLPFLAISVARSYDLLVNETEPINLKIHRLRLQLGKRLRANFARLMIAAYFVFMAGVIIGMWYSYRDASYESICTRINSYVKRSDIVAGPIIFWLGFHENRYVVTNVAPSFSPGDYVWLKERFTKEKPDVIIETTTDLQATEGTAPRPTTFDGVAYNRVIEDVARSVGYVCATVDSRDFGPVRIWRLEWQQQ